MNLRVSLIVILSIVLSACGGTSATASDTEPTSTCPVPQEGYVCSWDPNSQQWLYISSTALAWSQARMILPAAATTEQILQGGVYTTSYTLVAVLVPVTLVLNPNLIQNLVEGPPRLRVGNTLYVSQSGGAVQQIQLVGQITDANSAQKVSESNPSADHNNQPKKNIAILNDDLEFTSTTIEVVLAFATGQYNFVHYLTCDQLIAGMQNTRFEAYILDFNLADGELGSSCIPRIRAVHPQAWIVLRSSDERALPAAQQAGVEYQDTRVGSKGLADLLDGKIK